MSALTVLGVFNYGLVLLYGLFLSTLISGGVTALAVRWIEFQTKIKAVTDVLAMPKLFMYYAAVVGFALMTIYFFMHLCKAIYVLITNRPVKEVP